MNKYEVKNSIYSLLEDEDIIEFENILEPKHSISNISQSKIVSNNSKVSR